MKIINKKNINKAPKILWLVRMNFGGLVWGPIKLEARESEFDGEKYWFNEQYDIDVGINMGSNSMYKNKIIKLNEVYKGNYSDCFSFISDDKNKAQLFYDGASTLVKFMKEMWFDRVK